MTVRYSEHVRCCGCRDLVLRTMTVDVNGFSFCLECMPPPEEAGGCALS